MMIDRNYIYRVVNIVRNALSLEVPISLENLIEKIESFGCRCVPVDSEELKVDAEMMISGAGEIEIRYLQNKPKYRVLFSIAHELGHLFLHYITDEDWAEKKNVVFQRNGKSSKQELEANEFAAELLMPEEMFLEVCKENMSDDKRINIAEVANYFNVSIQAATVRGNVLRLW